MKAAKLTTVLALIIFGTLVASSAMAVSTANISVSANVLGTCTFDTTNYTMAFGAIDPLMAADATKSVNLAFTCTNGTNWQLDDVSGAKSMAGSGANTLNYSIDSYITAGTGNGTTQNVALTGRITQAQASAATVDSYTGTVTINLNPTP